MVATLLSGRKQGVTAFCLIVGGKPCTIHRNGERWQRMKKKGICLLQSLENSIPDNCKEITITTTMPVGGRKRKTAHCLVKLIKQCKQIADCLNGSDREPVQMIIDAKCGQ